MAATEESAKEPDLQNGVPEEGAQAPADAAAPGNFLQFYQCETSPDGTTSETPKALFVEKMAATMDPSTVTLAEIRTTVKDQRILKSMQTAPFCTKDGSEVKDTVILADYFAVCGSTQTGDDAVAATGSASAVYLKSTKIASAMDENFKNQLKTNFDRGLNLDTTQAAAPMISTQAPTLQSSFDMNNFMAVSGSADAIHPADMTEQQWSIVIRDSALLCGHRLTTCQVDGNDSKQTAVTAIERVEYPAFVLKPRKFQPYDFATLDAVRETYTIPYFQIDDDSYVRSIETKTSLQSSLAESSFSATDVQAAVGGGAFGATIGASAGVKVSNSQGNATDQTSDKEKLIMTYNFPRVCVTLDSESLDLSDECRNDLVKVTDIKSIEWFVKKYGIFYATRVQLGGRLSCSTTKEASGQSSEQERTSAFKAAASASFSSAFATGSASASHEQGAASKSLSKAADLDVSIVWEAQGGDTLLSNNPPSWCPTVSSFYNWRVIKQDQVQPLIDFIGQIAGYEDVPGRLQLILDAEQPPSQTEAEPPPIQIEDVGTLKLGQTLAFPKDLEKDNVIAISSSNLNKDIPSVGGDQTGLSLFDSPSGGNVVFHMSLRRTERQIVFNTCLGGAWGTEQRTSLDNRFEQSAPQILIHDQGDGFGVFIDQDRVFWFEKRAKDAKVKSISYFIRMPIQRSMLSDELGVKIYPSMARLLVGSS